MTPTPDALAVCRRDNTRLVARVVELEHERDAALAVVAAAAALVCYARGMADQLQPAEPASLISGGHFRALAATVDRWQREAAPAPAAYDPPPTCYNCGIPLRTHRDEALITRGGRTVSAHANCARHLVSQGWALVATARGMGEEAANEA